MKENIVKQKSYALRIMKLLDFLEEQRRHVLAKQVLKAGTSIGANAEESSAASSKRDFLSFRFRTENHSKHITGCDS